MIQHLILPAVIMLRERNSNIELYRIVVMSLIVAHHFVWHSGILVKIAENPLSSNSLFYNLFGLWGKVGVNSFVMITGYFMCQSRLTLRKYLKLLFEVEFYNVVIYAVMVFAGYETFCKSGLFLTLNPIKSISTDFTSCFLCFMLFIPFLNTLIDNLSQQRHLRLIGICLLVFTLGGVIPGFEIKIEYVSWFCVLYLLSSYIRLHEYPYKGNSKFWLCMSFLCVTLSCLSVLGFIMLKVNTGYWIYPYLLVNDSNTLFAVLTAFCTFNYVVSLRVRYNRVVNVVASSMFAVLLIHDNVAIRPHIWTDWLHVVDWMYEPHYVLNAFLIVSIIVVLCVAIDQIRIKTLERCFFSLVVDKILRT